MPAKKKKSVTFQLVQRSYFGDEKKSPYEIEASTEKDTNINHTGVWIPLEDVLKNDRKGPTQHQKKAKKNQEGYEYAKYYNKEETKKEDEDTKKVFDLNSLKKLSGTVPEENDDDIFGDEEEFEEDEYDTFDEDEREEQNDVSSGPVKKVVNSAQSIKSIESKKNNSQTSISGKKIDNDNNEEEDELFKNAEEAEFGADFIQQMLVNPDSEKSKNHMYLYGESKKSSNTQIIEDEEDIALKEKWLAEEKERKERRKMLQKGRKNETRDSDNEDLFLDATQGEEGEYNNNHERGVASKDENENYVIKNGKKIEYNQHESYPIGTLEKQFNKMFMEFEMDENINEFDFKAKDNDHNCEENFVFQGDDASAPTQMSSLLEKASRSYGKKGTHKEVSEEEIDSNSYDKIRTQGLVKAEQYAPVMQEFLDDYYNKREYGTIFTKTKEEGKSNETQCPKSTLDIRKNKKKLEEEKTKEMILQKMKEMTIENRVFDTNMNSIPTTKENMAEPLEETAKTEGGAKVAGEFLVSVLPDKYQREKDNLRINIDESAKTTLTLLEQQEKAKEEKRARKQSKFNCRKGKSYDSSESDSEEKDIIELKVNKNNNKNQKLDCETVLTTYSTLYNHPNVIHVAGINASKRKNRITDGKTSETSQFIPFSKDVANLSAGNQETSSEDEDEDVVTIDISSRPQNETNEEKKERRKLIKELQREKRQMKKETKTGFKRAQINFNTNKNAIKTQKTQTTLTPAKGY